MKFSYLIIQALALVFMMCTATAQSSFDHVDQEIKSKPLDLLITDLVKNNNWPNFKLNNSDISNLMHLSDPSETAILLLEKIRLYENANGHTTQTSLKAASLYHDLSSVLEKKGGYINLCLADALNRLIVARLAEIVNEKWNDKVFIDNKIKVLIPPKFSTQIFLTAIQQDSQLQLLPDVDLMASDEATLRERLAKALSIEEDNVLMAYATGQESTSELIKKVNFPVLLHRMGQTDVMGNVALAGLIEFYERGGYLRDINIMDNRPFKLIMGKNAGNFKSGLMNIKKVTPTLILEMLDKTKDRTSISFVGIALE